MGYKEQTQLNEKDALLDYLSQTKSLAKLYCTAITEFNDKTCRTALKRLLGEVLDEQYEIYKEMKKHGYYQVEEAPQKDACKAKKQTEKLKKQLNKA